MNICEIELLLYRVKTGDQPVREALSILSLALNAAWQSGHIYGKATLGR